MPKSEENDLEILVLSLKKLSAKKFRKQLKSISLKDSPIKLILFDSIQKNTFDKNSFIKKHKLKLSKFNYIKFELFQDVINHLKIHPDEYTGIALQNETIEFELLLKNGLYIKANRKLKRIKKIAVERCDFKLAYSLQRKALTYRLFEHIDKVVSLKKTSKEIIEYLQLEANLNAYVLLNYEILELHYEFLDRRVKDRLIILKYLDNDLLQHESKAKSILAKYHFYLIKSLIYIGDNDYKQSKKYALLAYKHLSINSSKYRNDYTHCMIALNNYLDSSLNLLETEPFEATYPKMIELANSTNKKDIYSEFQTFQQLCSLHLNYLWLKKDFTSFLAYTKYFEKSYVKYEANLSPNFKLEILLGLARMYFWNGDLKEANTFCEQIASEKSNPTLLFMACGNLLRVMINIDMGNYKLIAHLINTGKYFLKSRDRLFEVERCFFNGINKVKSFYSENQKNKLFENLYEEVSLILLESEEMVIDKKIDLIKWLKQKIE